MKKFICLLLSAACLTAAQFSNAQQSPQKKTVAVVKISATDAAKKLAEAQGGGLSLQSVSESLESNIVSALQSSRKFQILTRSDLPEAMKEADFANSGNSAGSKNFSFKGADYILTVKINDFQDYIKTANFALLGKSAQKRMLRLNAVANIIDSSTGAVVESANLEVSDADISDLDSGVRENSNLNQELLPKLSKALADKIAERVTEVAFPAKVVAKTGSTVTVNRGDGTSVKVGDIYDVYVLSGDLIDPDTGENLGSEEIAVGKVEIIAIRPKFSQARAIKDNGIARGHILRKSQAQSERD